MACRVKGSIQMKFLLSLVVSHALTGVIYAQDCCGEGDLWTF
jgi:hypothetical protein